MHVSLEQLINDCKNKNTKAQEQIYRLLSAKMFDAPAAFNKVTVDDIKNVAKKYFKKTTRTVGILKANTEE